MVRFASNGMRQRLEEFRLFCEEIFIDCCNVRTSNSSGRSEGNHTTENVYTEVILRSVLVTRVVVEKLLVLDIRSVCLWP